MIYEQPINLMQIGVRDTLTGYLVPGHVGDGAWMAWENSSAAVVAVVAAVAHVAGLMMWQD